MNQPVLGGHRDLAQLLAGRHVTPGADHLDRIARRVPEQHAARR